MKSIIGERPNANPVGIGNSTSELDLDVLAPGTHNDESSDEDTEPAKSIKNDDDNKVQEASQSSGWKKRSASVAEMDEDIKPKRGTPARPNASKPTTVGPKSKKPKGLDELVEIACAEETTRQKELELQIQKSKVDAEVKKAKIEMKKEREKQAHEAEMMKIRLEFARIHQNPTGFTPGGISAQLSQSNTQSSGVYPPFNPGCSFGESSQFGGIGGSGSVGDGSFEGL